jgi:hypothetical protein
VIPLIQDPASQWLFAGAVAFVGLLVVAYSLGRSHGSRKAWDHQAFASGVLDGYRSGFEDHRRGLPSRYPGRGPLESADCYQEGFFSGYCNGWFDHIDGKPDAYEDLKLSLPWKASA